MMRASLLLLLMSGAALAQPAASPAFEVASVKTAPPDASGAVGLFTYPGGRIVASLAPLEYLIMEAFDIQPFQIRGLPPWAREAAFNIEARPPAASKSAKANPPYPKAPPNDEQRRMLQTLLADRFRLQYHREAVDGPVYLLLKGNSALKLVEPKDKGDYPWAGSVGGGAFSGDGIAGRNISMPQLAFRLSRYLRRPVLDRTGLAGSFDFRFEYESPASDNSRADLISSIFTSLQGVGLKLESAKGPVETIVVDHVEKPSEN